jgi:hypothetical protein
MFKDFSGVVFENKAGIHARSIIISRTTNCFRSIIKSHMAQVNAQLSDDYEQVLLGYYKSFAFVCCDIF